jgi:hypothetical protein
MHLSYVHGVYVNKPELLKEEVVESRNMYRVMGREEWEKLRKESPEFFGREPRWLSKRQAIYTGDCPPEVVMTYPEILETAARVIEQLPVGKLVVDANLNFYDAAEEVLRIAYQSLYKEGNGRE